MSSGEAQKLGNGSVTDVRSCSAFLDARVKDYPGQTEGSGGGKGSVLALELHTHITENSTRQ